MWDLVLGLVNTGLQLADHPDANAAAQAQLAAQLAAQKAADEKRKRNNIIAIAGVSTLIIGAIITVIVIKNKNK